MHAAEQQSGKQTDKREHQEQYQQQRGMFGGNHARMRTIRISGCELTEETLSAACPVCADLIHPQQNVSTALSQADDGPGVFFRITLECCIRIYRDRMGDFFEQRQIIQ